jgi:hypothetical protein
MQVRLLVRFLLGVLLCGVVPVCFGGDPLDMLVWHDGVSNIVTSIIDSSKQSPVFGGMSYISCGHR